MTVGTFIQPEFGVQEPSAVKINIQNCIMVLARLAAAFAPHEQAVPNMTVRIDAGSLFAGGTLTEVAGQNTATITAPTTQPRIDRVVIDQITGVNSVITGTEASSPSPPAIPAGKMPICQILLATSTTAITNTLLTDERVSSFNLESILTAQGGLISRDDIGIIQLSPGASGTVLKSQGPGDDLIWEEAESSQIPVPSLVHVDGNQWKIPAYGESPVSCQMKGFPNWRHKGQWLDAGLTDGKIRTNLDDITVNIDTAGDRWGTEKTLQWYMIYALAGDEDTTFTAKCMPIMRVKSTGTNIIYTGSITNPATGIGYGFTTNELQNYVIYFLSGVYAGAMRTITANNNDNGTGGTLTYGSTSLSPAQGDWFVVLPNTNFCLLGDFYNYSLTGANNPIPIRHGNLVEIYAMGTVPPYSQYAYSPLANLAGWNYDGGDISLIYDKVRIITMCDDIPSTYDTLLWYQYAWM
ncbi:MAG: hypothetical protein A2Y80_02205 [Deltaproteobacteria bacterium RBG_13_58_19]|nr:MAG: hypothetical protein A2Y80_02205 [Deltaproteobacteria bacterium RBG_13_58_19]